MNAQTLSQIVGSVEQKNRAKTAALLGLHWCVCERVFVVVVVVAEKMYG